MSVRKKGGSMNFLQKLFAMNGRKVPAFADPCHMGSHNVYPRAQNYSPRLMVRDSWMFSELPADESPGNRSIACNSF